MATSTAGFRVTDILDEEECYLLAILEDESGIDLAEMIWEEPDINVSPDGCWRAWPFQWSWWRDNAPFMVDQCGRAVGKTTGIVLRGFIFPFVHPGSEMLITAPELIHQEPITDLIVRRFGESRLGQYMHPTSRGWINRRPFMMKFVNNARIIGRIPHRDGSGVKGMHPLWLEQDEAQDYPKPGWTELVPTLKQGVPGTSWRAHGVTRGMRDEFWRVTQPSPDNEWVVHRITQMHRPNWSNDERRRNIAEFGGSREHPDYRRNVRGLHGDSQNPLFVLARLMSCVDEVQGSEYNVEEYTHIRVSHESLQDKYEGELDITTFLDLPNSHTAKYDTFWIGMDVGYTDDPTEILVFAEELVSPKERTALGKLNKAIPPDGTTRLKLLTRVHLDRIRAPQQVAAVGYIFNFYRPKAFSMDSTGNGLPLYQILQHEFPAVAEKIRGYNFSEKVLVDFDNSVILEEGDDEIKEAGIKKLVIEYSTDVLRDLVDMKRLWLPWDELLLKEFNGQTFKNTSEKIDRYGRTRRTFSKGNFHALDAARMAALGWKQYAIEALVKEMQKDKFQPVLDVFIT